MGRDRLPLALCLVAVATAALLTAGVAARPAATRTAVVLGVVGDGAPEALAEMADRWRSEASTARGYEWIAQPSWLERLDLASTCVSATDRCLARVGRMMGADVVFFARIDRRVASLVRMDVDEVRTTASVRALLPSRPAAVTARVVAAGVRFVRGERGRHRVWKTAEPLQATAWANRVHDPAGSHAPRVVAKGTRMRGAR